MLNKLEDRSEQQLNGIIFTLEEVVTRIENRINSLEGPVVHDDSWPIKESAYEQFAGEMIRDITRWKNVASKHLNTIKEKNKG